jgi:glyoxalase-like protein
MIRSIVRNSALLLALASSSLSARAQTSAPSPSRVDHILLWGRSIDEVTAIFAVKLGFQIQPGHDPSGVANRYVRLADHGYVELLGITRPNPTLDPGMAADQASLHGGAGARMFGISSPSPEKLRAALAEKGFHVTPVFTSSTPAGQDSSSPRAPDWRLFAFEQQPLSSGLFFIDYARGYAMPTSAADDEIIRTHPNGARALSAVWLLSANADSDRKQMEKLGFTGARPIRIPQLAARGFCVPIGSTYVLALQPDGSGVSADALRKGGPQVMGISIAVSDLDRTQRWIERGYQQKLERYVGALGSSVLAPTQNDLGMLIEFHASANGARNRGCGGLKAEKAGSPGAH